MKRKEGEEDLRSLAEAVRSFEGVKRKRAISTFINLFGDSDKVGNRTIIGFGEDAAVLEIDSDNLILLSTDGIWGKLLNADPWWAGYCSVLVNVNDIVAMGGTPIAMVNLTSTRKKWICERLTKGMKEGVEKFGVPMVGGHVHPDTSYDALDVGIVGVVKKNCAIYSNGAKPGDKVIIGIDIDGRIYPAFDLAWDSTTRKSVEEIKKQMKTMAEIGEKRLATAGKDISNPGTLGTLGMLLEVSNVGATVEVDKIPRPSSEDVHVPFDHWLKMYPGSGFVLTVEDEERGRKCIEIFNEAGIEASMGGEIDGSKKLKITNGEDTETVFDLNKEIITGIK